MMSSTHWTRQELVDLLAEMVRRPSFGGRETAVAEFMGDWLARAGFRVEYDEVEPGRRNLVAEAGTADSGPTLLFWGHMDTVPPVPSWTSDPLEPIIDGDTMIGLGTEDMKGGLVSIMLAARAVAAGGLAAKGLSAMRWRGRLMIAAVVDEEAYSRGAQAFLKTLDVRGPVHASVLAEPHFHTPRIGGVGKLLLRVDVKGRSSHAGRPWLGVNAVEEGARFLTAWRAKGVPSHDVVGEGSMSTLSFRGGPEEYSLTVPEHCSILINRHIVPGESAETVVAEMQNVVTQLQSPASFEFHVLPPYYPPYLTNRDDPFVHLFQQSRTRVIGSDGALGYSPSVCDANYIVADYGVPTVVFGPSGGNLHAAQEWVDLNQVDAAARVLVDLATRYLT